jgi:hypothetical protein
MNASLPISAMAPLTSNGAAMSPVELVRAMTPEDKQAVFLVLLREALQIHGDRGLLPIEDEDGKMFGYYVPPEAAKELADQQWAEMPTPVQDRFRMPIKNPEDCISAEEMLANLNRAVDS